MRALKTPSAAEQAAREDLEARHGHSLTNEEWHRNSHRLMEFVAILTRWDAEQCAVEKCAKMEAKAKKEQVA